jgi:tetratricopeptide (TPR) repeat protein
MGEYEAALSLNPTPQQKIRLILTLTRVQTLYGRDKEAYGWYQKFLKEFPDYPDLLGIYQKILPLAETVGTKDNVEKYRQEITKLSPPAAPSKN